MTVRNISMLAMLLIMAAYLASGVWAGQVGIYLDSDDQQTLYFRKVGNKRFLDPVPGDQLVNDNVAVYLHFWGDHIAERPFVLNGFSLELHLDATIVSYADSSKIKVALVRNQSTVYTAEVYKLPAGFSGQRPIDIITDEVLYPGITFNQGDELSFYFQQIKNFNPCQFRYNSTGGRDDSHLILQIGAVNYPVVELDPVGIDISLDFGESADTSFFITNGGFNRLFYEFDLPQGQQILSYGDTENASQYWPISDQFNRDFFNVRFTPAQACTLTSARLLFSPDGTQGDPDLVVYVWDDTSGFPRAKLDSVVVPNGSLNLSPSWQTVIFSGQGLVMRAQKDFHIGYTAIRYSSGDALAIFSDDGLPVGNGRRSSGKWGDNWYTMYDRQDVDANFFIQAIVKYGHQPVWLSHDLPLGSLPAYSSHQIGLYVDAAGLSEGVYKSGLIIENNSPDPMMVLPVILRVGQTSVDQRAGPAVPENHALVGNFPNPFNSETRIRYQVGSIGDVYSPIRLSIYNIFGQRVRLLVNGLQPPGEHDTWWDGRDEGGDQVASGLYFCRLEAGTFRDVRKIVLLK